MNWQVRKVFYMTYAEIEQHGERPAELLAKFNTHEQAIATARELRGSEKDLPVDPASGLRCSYGAFPPIY